MTPSGGRSRGVATMSDTRAVNSDTGSRGKRLIQIAKSHADIIAALPDGKFANEDIPQHASDNLRTFEDNGIVEVHGERLGTGRKYIKVYEVVNEAREIARDQINYRQSVCPCNHSGFVNHGEYYTCGFRYCPNTYRREDLEADS